MLDNQPFAAFTRYQREFPASLRSIHNQYLPLLFPSSTFGRPIDGGSVGHAGLKWYQSPREQWKPSHIRLLLVGESAPDDGGDPGNRRFFYSEPLNQADNLFRSVVAALYDSGKLTKGDLKEPWLAPSR